MREQAVHESLRKFKLSKDDRVFRKQFLDCLITKHFGQTVLAHDVYRELYPLDRPQNIMKSTCWETLGVFIAQLRKERRVEAHKGVKGWQIRVSSDDFEDLDSLDDAPDEGKGENKKRKHDSKSGERDISVVGDPVPDPLESHSESTKLSDHAKLNFNLGSVKTKSTKFSSNPTIPSAFAAESSDSESAT